MSTQFDMDFGNGDIIDADHIKQFAQPVNDLESGVAFFRVATDETGVYQVDFRSSANPEGHAVSTLAAGQLLTFKASHDSPTAAQLKVLTDGGGGSATHPLFLSNSQIEEDEIRQDQIVSVVFNDMTSPRFDVIGVRGVSELNELVGVSVSSPSTGEVLRYDGSQFANAELVIDDVDGLSAAITSAGGSTTGHLSELQALTLSEGDLLTTNSSGEITKLVPGNEGEILKISSSGVPAWGELLGGGGDWLISSLVAHGARPTEITSTSEDLRSSAFTPVVGGTYLIRWIANHTSSVAQLNLASAVSNSQPHFCRAVETGDSTVHDIGFSGGGAFDYTCDQAQRTRTHEFVWTSGTSNEVQIVMGQPSLSYGEFTGTLLVYRVRPEATNLGWGTFGSTYRWLNNASVQTNSLSGGSYTSVSLDANKTYAFLGRWCRGYSLKMVLRQGSTYWRLPPNSDTWVSASGTDNAWQGGMYYEWSYVFNRGEFIRLFSPPSTGTFDLGCCLYDVVSGCFWLIELPN